MALPKAPVLFTKPRTALADPYPAAIPIPKCAQDGTSDYEAELCVVIGKSGRNIPEEKALDYVLGYTASNDVSARTLQMLTTQWSFSKGLDGSCPVGRSQTAPPSVFHYLLCRARSRLAKNYHRPSDAVSQGDIQWPDGPGRQHQVSQIACSTSASFPLLIIRSCRDMIFDIKKQIAYLSQGTTLEAGTIFVTGTPAGIGIFRQPRVVLEDGGDIRIYISEIGTLVNKVHYEKW